MRQLAYLLSSLIILKTVSGISSNRSIFDQRVFNNQSFLAPNLIDICQTSDLSQVQCSSDQNTTVYKYSCMMDSTSLTSSTFVQCNETNETNGGYIFQYLNLTTLIRNTTYLNRQDYDLSNCTLSPDQSTFSCVYLYSVQDQPLISVFRKRVFNGSIFDNPDETDLCYTNDFINVKCSSDQNTTFLDYFCIMDTETFKTSSFLQCNGTPETNSSQISQYLNLTTFIRNTTYANRQDYDLSNCTLSSDKTYLQCNYLYSVQSQASESNSSIQTSFIPSCPANISNTTVQVNSYVEFCEYYQNVTPQLILSNQTNLTSSLNESQPQNSSNQSLQLNESQPLNQSDQSLALNESQQQNSSNQSLAPALSVMSNPFSINCSSSRNQYSQVQRQNCTQFYQSSLGSYISCNYSNSDGSYKNQTIYTNTLTTFISNQSNPFVDVLQNVQNLSSNGKSYIESQYLFSFNQTDSQLYNPYICNGSISNMKQTCSQDNFKTIIVYNCVYSSLQQNSLICQQEDGNSTSKYSLDETKYLNIQTGLQYVQYGNCNRVTVKYCKTDFATLNDYCIYLYSYYQNASDQRQSAAIVNITFENQGNENLTIIWKDYFGNEQVYMNLAKKQAFQQSSVQGDVWRIQNSTNNQQILNYVTQNRNDFIKLPLSSAIYNNTQNYQNISFTNQLNFSVSLNLVNSYNREVTYRVLVPGENYNQSSLPGTQWVLRNVSTNKVIFTCFGSVLQSKYAISSVQNYTLVNQTQSSFSQRQNYNLTCNGTYTQQTCTHGYSKKVFSCQTTNQSISCQSNQTQKQTIFLSNITYIQTMPNFITVMKCNNSMDTVYFNQTCSYLFTIYNLQINQQNQIFQVKNNQSYIGVPSTKYETVTMNLSQQIPGTEITLVYNNSQKISQCSYNLNGNLYCTIDRKGLQFNVINCTYNQQFGYVGCSIVNQVQCLSLNTSGCIYSIYYDPIYDYNAYLLYLQNNIQLQNNSKANLTMVYFDIYSRVQTKIYYNSKGAISSQVDNQYGQICFTVDSIMCVNSGNNGFIGNGTYCYSYNGQTCFTNNGPQCNLSSGYQCATYDGINPEQLLYCVSYDNQTCYSDAAQLCGSANLLQCNISRQTNICSTLNGQSCFVYGVGWKFTQDGSNSYKNALPNGKNGTYCYSADGNLCGRVTLKLLKQDSYQCLTTDNVNCLQDQGAVCNSTENLNWCNIQNNTQSCISLDMKYCLKGTWIKTSSTLNSSGNTTFCYSADGLTCKKALGGVNCQKGNSLSTYLCNYQKDQNGNYINNLTILYQCLSYDNINCFNDLESNCGNTPTNSFCSIKNAQNYCQTSNNINCASMGPGIYYTYDGINVSPLFPVQFQIQGSKCFSSNGVFCDQSYGPNCNPVNGSNCANIDKINPVLAVQCSVEPTAPTKQCEIDSGSSCKPTKTNLDGSCGLKRPLCLSADGAQTCLQLNSGWYYTQNSMNVYQKMTPNGLRGTYCFSQDGMSCQLTLDPKCASNQNQSQCINRIQCLSLDNNNSCYNDTGSLCNQTTSLNQICSISLYSNNCSSLVKDGQNCYNPNMISIANISANISTTLSYSNQTSQSSLLTIQKLWCFTTDNINCFSGDSSANIVGSYCQTQDGYVCYQDYGPNCNLKTGYLCTTTDRVNLFPASYCVSINNQTCLRDKGSFCQSPINSYCQISSSQSDCFSIDGFNCYEFLKRWYFTTDQVNVYNGKINQAQIGSYCYSNNGKLCEFYYNSFTSNDVSYCLSKNNQTCIQDYGAYCSNSQNINYCFILNNTNLCETIDQVTCSNVNWIKRKNSNSLCYSIDGKSCLITNGGIYCKFWNSDYLCAYAQGGLQQLAVCLSYDNKICYPCTNTNYRKCFTAGDISNFCNTLDGDNCLQLSSGWYYSNNGLAVGPTPNFTNALAPQQQTGVYCKSDDSYKCSQSYGFGCNVQNYANCAQDQFLNFLNVSQCITQDNSTCYKDKGQICAPIRKKNPVGNCDLQITIFQCSLDTTDPSNSCFDYMTGWYFSLDGINVNQIKNQNGSYGSYCYSKNGIKCLSNNGGACDKKSGYKCSSVNGINPVNVSYCISFDNQNCVYDKGLLCNQSGLLSGSCQIQNTTSSCETLDQLKCYNNLKKWYVTYDGLNVGLNFQNLNQLRSYCYSENGQSCKQNYGPQCNSSSDYMCTTSDGISLAISAYCISFDKVSCYQDYGLLCNYTGTNPWCNIYNQSSNCPTLNGQTCFDFKSGWYFTQDYNKAIPQNSLVKSNGAYCFSNNAASCYSDYGPNCDPSTGNLCATSDGITPQQINYCISDDLKQCKMDQGQFCNFTGNQIWCNIYTYYQSCLTMNGNNQCYNILSRYYISYDGVNVNTQLNGIKGYFATYCQSQDGLQCYNDFGNQCNLLTGSLCSTSNGVNLQAGTYCISANGQTCYKDVGGLCNNPNQLNWCKILNNTSNCFTQDGQTCFNINKQFCLTFDGKNCTTQMSSFSLGRYCWSNDASTCSSNGVPNCNPSQGQICSAPQNATFCITQDSNNCLQDSGYYCNNTYDLTSCNINYDLTQYCMTYDTIKCAQGSQLQLTSDQIQRRNFRNYFFYAITGNISNYLSVGVCSPDCQTFKDKCCVNVLKQTSTSNQQFDKLCMNKYVTQSITQFQLNGNSYLLQCVQVTLQNTMAIYIRSYLLPSFLISSIILLISIF